MKSFLSEEKINLGRQSELDYAKVIAVIFMVLIHVWEELSFFKCYDMVPIGFWHNLLQFGAGPLAAPIFMFALGVGICYSKNRTPIQFFKRGLHLFLLAYLLNICRNSIYYVIYYAVNDNFDLSELIYQTFNGDILHFAGLSFMLVALLKKCKMPVLAMGGLSIIMQIIGYYLSINLPVSEGLNYIVGLFYYTKSCCFPLLQWFIYPVSGIVFAKYLRHVTDKTRFYRFIFWISSILLIIFCLILNSIGYDIQNFYILVNDTYYQQELLHSIFTILIILVELSILYFVSIKIKSDFINGLVHYVSNNLNLIYIIQWMLVGTATFIVMMLDIGKFNSTSSIILGFVFIILSFLISIFLTKKRNQIK